MRKRFPIITSINTSRAQVRSPAALLADSEKIRPYYFYKPTMNPRLSIRILITPVFLKS